MKKIEIKNNTPTHRYEADIDGSTAYVEYELADKAIIFTHTVVPQEYEGQGIAGQLAKFALEEAKSKGQKVVPQCQYIKSYIQRHPEYGDLVRK